MARSVTKVTSRSILLPVQRWADLAPSLLLLHPPTEQPQPHTAAAVTCPLLDAIGDEAVDEWSGRRHHILEQNSMVSTVLVSHKMISRSSARFVHVRSRPSTNGFAMRTRFTLSVLLGYVVTTKMHHYCPALFVANCTLTNIIWPAINTSNAEISPNRNEHSIDETISSSTYTTCTSRMSNIPRLV